MALGTGSMKPRICETISKDLEGKKRALLIVANQSRKQGKTDRLSSKNTKIGLEDKILKYNLKPISVGVFGGIIDYNKLGFLLRKGMEVGYKSLQKYGFKEVESGVYDLRDWGETVLG